MSGLFITFEGGEGAGKSTQIKRLALRLNDMSYKTLITNDPGGTPRAKAIRYAVLSGAAKKFGSEIEAVLFAAARDDNVQNIIKPALLKGKIVLCDRFLDSSRVYQGVSGEVDQEFLLGMEKVVTEGVKPDLTLILDLPPEEGLKRSAPLLSKKGRDRFESENIEEQIKRRNGFLEIARSEPDRCIVINASDSFDKVSDTIDTVIDTFLMRRERQ
ncbi:dTMP kinase [Candidatus Endowatersipora endosymbiont of Watersipora subatra]|uniref:dTMP kinase n=1 Tax=Candidatus Endowatersipora endosymbiont of Watersipora subatra TaxID=3077946 RepID=UPI00312C89DF